MFRRLLLALPLAASVACLNSVSPSDEDDGDGPPGPQDQGGDTGTSTDGGSGDGGTDGGTDTDEPQDSELAKMQQYDGYAEDDVVTFTAVVTTPNTGSGFFVADAPGPWAAMWVYHGGASDAVQGDVVEVTGTLFEFNDLTEVDASEGSVAVTGTGQVPAPTTVGVVELVDDPEPYEGVIIRIEDAVVSDENPDGPDEDYGEFEVEGNLRVDDYFYDADPVTGDAFSSLTGPLIYTFGQFKLAPRYPSDVVE